MPQLSLFETDHPPPLAARLGPKLRALAGEGVWFGTSSWKYEGWLDQVYSPGRYTTRGRFSPRRFAAECLAEYARTFPAACGDFSFYQFPDRHTWRRLFGAVPESFRFAFKVPEEITVATWPTHARYGPRAGGVNPSFLDARRFAEEFAKPLGQYRGQVAALIFEFGAFPRSTFARPGDFVARLGPFLDALPPGFRYAVEVRNPEFLVPEYFGALADRNVAHVFNAWTRMPELPEQVGLSEAHTADFAVARALLRRGRPYERAVAAFEPYRAVQDPNPPARAALADLADRARRLRRPAFLFVNNRLEGNAPATIEAVAGALGD